MKLISKVQATMLALGLALAAPAFAGDDSSADAASGFNAVKESTGALIRVPINEKGEELASAAELRLASGGDQATSGDFRALFASAADLASAPQVSADDVNRDSSTHGWYGWQGYGWQTSYYYTSYRPTYYYSGTYYTYYQPVYQTYYGGGSYYGYRYYYYNRCW